MRQSVDGVLFVCVCVLGMKVRQTVDKMATVADSLSEGGVRCLHIFSFFHSISVAMSTMHRHSSRIAAFLQADARPIFSWPRSAPTAQPHVSLGLPNGHFRSEGSLRITAAIAPCGLRGCKNGPAPFPGRMSYKATKPGLVCLSYRSMLYYCIVVY